MASELVQAGIKYGGIAYTAESLPDRKRPVLLRYDDDQPANARIAAYFKDEATALAFRAWLLNMPGAVDLDDVK